MQGPLAKLLPNFSFCVRSFLQLLLFLLYISQQCGYDNTVAVLCATGQGVASHGLLLIVRCIDFGQLKHKQTT